MSGRLFAVTVVFASLWTALTAGPVNAEPREAEELFDRPKSVLRYDIEDAEKGKADSVKYTRDGVVVVRKGGRNSASTRRVTGQSRTLRKRRRPTAGSAQLTGRLTASARSPTCS